MSKSGPGLLFLLLLFAPVLSPAETIDRRAVVSRHDVVLRKTMPASPSQVGNGHFAFGMDITGMQSFVPFNTMSDWGWHSSPLPKGCSITDYRPQVIESYGKKIPYLLDDPAQPELSVWLKSNPHRVNLGRIGMVLLKAGGCAAKEDDLDSAAQKINLWSGQVSSNFSLDGEPVNVITVCHPEKDILAFRLSSPLLRKGRIRFFVDFPGWDGKSFGKFVGEWSDSGSHVSGVVCSCSAGATLSHKMDDLSYYVKLHWKGADVTLNRRDGCHRFEFTISSCDDCEFEFSVQFATDPSEEEILSFGTVRDESADAWENYWKSGAAVDMSGSEDSRWFELERRVVLSQYQMRLNESGIFPPQESGLVNNGWYGRFHWEMIWWHAAHWFLWDRQQCADGYLSVYPRFLESAKGRARSEGRNGARWPKCTGDINREWPCDVHSFLVWQQPHPIWFAEAEYRRNPTPETLDKWRDIVLNTADYIADCVFWDGRRYVIGPPAAPVSENTDYLSTLNPVFELAYFRYGLRTALTWADRLHLPQSRTDSWRNVLDGLAELPREDGMYKTAESVKDMWTKYNFEHPALTGIFGVLPGDGVDPDVFRCTFRKVLDVWQMDRCWGWDYPMLAMAAARLGDPSIAVDLLCSEAHKFSFDAHGLADVWPFPYFPANGALLTAVAMMCGGWDGGPGTCAPGFPKSWNVRYEGFRKMQ